MKEPLVRIRLDGNGRVYCPGETLAGSYRLEGIAPQHLRAVEVSILWHTEGKGDEDLAVHDFRRLSVEAGDAIDPRRPGRFSTVLPNSPLSYRGVIVKIRWCVRVRVFLTRAREVVGELHFRLGEVLPPRSTTFWSRPRAAADLMAIETEPEAAGESPSVPVQQPTGDATGNGGRVSEPCRAGPEGVDGGRDEGRGIGDSGLERAQQIPASDSQNPVPNPQSSVPGPRPCEQHPLPSAEAAP